MSDLISKARQKLLQMLQGKRECETELAPVLRQVLCNLRSEPFADV